MDVLDLAISGIGFLTTREKKLLRKNIDSLDNLALLSIEEIVSITGRKTRGEWNGSLVRSLAHKAESIMESKGIHCAVWGEPGFPAMLGTINDPPYCFFYRGCLEVLEKKCVSVVGTRLVCQETAVAALEFSKDAAANGQTVVSGLANGIDTFAHRGALQSGAKGATAAVLPCGIESVVPYGNRGLASSILKNGGLLCSEYLPGTPAENWRFVQRNRLIAALSSATVIVQAPKGSGALITADFAVSYNRDVLFHKAAFCEQAKLCESHGRKKVKDNAPSSERYVLDGAPVIENYADYVRVMENPPGTFSMKDRQLELF